MNQQIMKGLLIALIGVGFAVKLSAQEGRVVGAVVDPAGIPSLRAVVYLIPVTGVEKGEHHMQVRRCLSEKDGFRFEKVPIGMYELISSDVFAEARVGGNIVVRENTTTVVSVTVNWLASDCIGKISEQYDKIEPRELERPNQFLQALGEPLLGIKDKRISTGEQLYRMLYIPSFENSIFVRIVVLPDGSGKLTWKESENLTGGSEPGRLLRSGVLKVSPAEMAMLLGTSQKEFWALLPASACCVVSDGYTLLLEGQRGDTMKAVVRHTPMDASVDIRKRLLDLIALDQGH